MHHDRIVMRACCSEMHPGNIGIDHNRIVMYRGCSCIHNGKIYTDHDPSATYLYLIDRFYIWLVINLDLMGMWLDLVERIIHLLRRAMCIVDHVCCNQFWTCSYMYSVREGSMDATDNGADRR